MSSNPPTTLGKYQIIREIARSNDIVYEAYDPMMNRRVALKELAVPPGSTPQQREDRIKRFLREAKAAGSLSHPNIMTVYDFDDEGGRYYIAMEFLDGHTLRNELDTHGALTPEKALDIAIEVAQGLEFAHKSGVVHRDIKPENIQLLTDGRVKLTDFGIARLTFEPNITMDGQVFGTPSYMSPEQVVGKDIDARSDVFSLGVVLYEMLSGKKPFTGDSVVSITYAIMNREPERPPETSFAVWQVLERALDKSPALRFASAGEMIQALKDAKVASSSVVIDPMHTMQGTPAFQTPMMNPYIDPFTQPPQPPPATYAYNPYHQTGMPHPVGQTTIPPGYMPTAMPPSYYAIPRQPLIKPETKRFLGRLAIILGVIGTLFTLVIVAIWSAGALYQRVRNDAHDTEIREELARLDPSIPLPEKISKYEHALERLKDKGSLIEVNQKLAGLYKEEGDRLLAIAEQDGTDPDKFTAASALYQRAVETDPENPAWREAFGDFFVKMAQRASGSTRRERYRSAADQFEQASFQYDRVSSNRMKQKAALAYFESARLSLRESDGATFWADLQKVQELAQTDELKARAAALRNDPNAVNLGL
jgi:serine/threonine protein kinase